ncbi:MAG: ribosome assembly cofactor RimP [Tenuifilaceae bacterium]
MITKEQIEQIAMPKIDEEGLFLVEITVNSSNHIVVLIDSEKGVTIEQCIVLSKHIEQNLNRDIEDFELDVASSGLGQPLKVLKQYVKNIGQDVDLVLLNGQKITGKLLEANQEGISVEAEKNVLVEGKKRKQLVTETISLKYKEIKTTKVVVSFR